MDRAEELVSQFALARFTKIHLDTSMRLASDSKTARLSDATIARRGARLCKAAEAAYAKRLQAHPDAIAPVYVIGSEVPIPGGAQEAEDSISVTKPKTAWPPMGPSTRPSWRRASRMPGSEPDPGLVVPARWNLATGTYSSTTAPRLRT